jgi:broad specificity phosphatase PhoE
MNRFIRQGFFALGLAVMSGVFTGPLFGTEPKASIVFVVRHAEKSAPNGDLPLSEAGHERAETLAAMLAPAGVTHVYHTEMIRARETAAPLAARLGLTSRSIPVTAGEVLAGELRQLPAGSVALVVNHSGTIPTLLEKLGAPKPAPIDEGSYDRMFVVIRDPGAGVSSFELRYGRITGVKAAQ